MNMFEGIKTRRSIRKFSSEEVSAEAIAKILEAGRWAPSGKNNQPWKFMVLDKVKKDALAEFTKYSFLVKGANKLILIFLDKDVSYHYQKDLLAIGAAIENMLLCIHSLGLGACWMGEIRNQGSDIVKALGLGENLEFEAALALGKPSLIPSQGRRKDLKDLIIDG